MEVIIIIAIHLRITSFNLRDGFQFIFGKMTDREGMLLEARREWGYDQDRLGNILDSEKGPRY